jgi:hypothetical protein
MTREKAHVTLKVLAGSVHELTEDQAAVRLLERISASEDPSMLRDALVELGARAILREAQ